MASSTPKGAFRSRRCLLYLPGSSERMIAKAGQRGADVLVLDLEDGVHPDDKEIARGRVARALGSSDWGGSEVLVRANPLDTSWGEADLAMIRDVRPAPAGVVLPKVEEARVVREARSVLGGASARTPLLLMIETAAGVLAAPELARLDGVEALLFGAADYRESLRAGRSPEETELSFARARIVHAARAAGIEAYDTPWFEYKDLEGLEASSRRARLVGMDGKTAIHPSQVPVIQRVFSPSEAEIERARLIVEVMEAALANGRNVAVMGTEMVEALHLREAYRTLARAGNAG